MSFGETTPPAGHSFSWHLQLVILESTFKVVFFFFKAFTKLTAQRGFRIAVEWWDLLLVGEVLVIWHDVA